MSVWRLSEGSGPLPAVEGLTMCGGDWVIIGAVQKLRTATWVDREGRTWAKFLRIKSQEKGILVKGALRAGPEYRVRWAGAWLPCWIFWLSGPELAWLSTPCQRVTFLFLFFFSWRPKEGRPSKFTSPQDSRTSKRNLIVWYIKYLSLAPPRVNTWTSDSLETEVLSLVWEGWTV